MKFDEINFNSDNATDSTQGRAANSFQNEALEGLSSFKFDRGQSESAKSALPGLEIDGLDDSKETAGCQDYLRQLRSGQDLSPEEKNAKLEIDALTGPAAGNAGRQLKADIEKWAPQVGARDIDRQGLSGLNNLQLLNELKAEGTKGASNASGLRIATILEAMRTNSGK